MLIVSFILLLAAICNSIMDNITHHWDESIFERPKGEITKWDMWWNPEYSWRNKYQDGDPKKPLKKIVFGLFDKPFTDAWHTFKSLMITFLVASISCALFHNIWYILLSITVLGTSWNLVFNLFYNKLLKH